MSLQHLDVVFDEADVLRCRDELHHLHLLSLKQHLEFEEDLRLLMPEDVLDFVAAHLEGHAEVVLQLVQVPD